MPTVTDPVAARSAGTSALQLASSITAGSSPATTSNQYQPPSTKGTRVRSNDAELGPEVSQVQPSTRCERPFAIER
jgi:hypothetical protein